MSGSTLLDWAILAFSLFNTVILTWLGLTVLLNAERRRWGIWLAGMGLLLGGSFFLSHTAIIGQGLVWLNWAGMVFWWTAGLIPAVTLPFAWYLVILWYAGHWEGAESPLRRRHKPWLRLTTAWFLSGVLALGMGVLLLTVPAAILDPLRRFVRWSFAGIPLLGAGYSAYVIFCTALALDVLRRPGPSGRLMGSVARSRARPWLVTASVGQLVVSILVAGALLWAVQDTRDRTFLDLFFASRRGLGWLDLIISGILAMTILSLGEAIVAYEVFTGRTLPRRGLRRHWQGALALGLGCGVLGGAALALSWSAVAIVPLATLVMALLMALLGRQAFAERERAMASLRPFVSSQQLTDRLLLPSLPVVDVDAPFRALCENVLETRTATLAAWGTLAPLVGPPLRYPPGSGDAAFSLAGLARQFATPDDPALPVAPEQTNGAIWAIPLWSQRGLSGILMLGPRSDGGLYAQEEMDVAQAVGERLIDTQASTQLASRLMGLQREQLARNQILDQQTRRALHDDVLPAIHAIMLSLVAERGEAGPLSEAMGALHRQIADLLHQMPAAQAPSVGQLGLVGALREAVAGELAPHFRAVHWQLDAEAVRRAERLAPAMAEVIFYAAREAVRNAAAHGQDATRDEPPELWVRFVDAEELTVQIEDNGVGLASDAVGEGHGLALHSTMMSIIGGALSVESAPGQYTRVTLALPRALLGEAG